MTFGRLEFTKFQLSPLSVDSNNPISVPTQIIFGSCGITTKALTPTFGNPLDD